MNILVVVDMQNDFIDGALGTQEAQMILPKVVETTKSWNGPILFTRDTHGDNYLESQEGKHLPVPHCIRDTKGWEIASDLQEFVTLPPLDKPNFGSLDLVPRLRELQGNTPESELTITLIGLCTDICVLSNAIILKPAFPEASVEVIGDCCAGVTPDSHKNALSAMGMCQIKVV
ncbi:MAG: isochorismatase family cysteine hydrolase [Eubacteriales bacterium]